MRKKSEIGREAQTALATVVDAAEAGLDEVEHDAKIVAKTLRWVLEDVDMPPSQHVFISDGGT